VMIGALDIAIVGPALPAIRKAFDVDDRAIPWVFTIYVLFNLIGSPLLAKLSDRYGRRLVYLLAISLFGVGSLIVALSAPPHFWLLLVGRAAQGLGAGGIFPVASAVIGDTFPENKRGSALGLIGAVFGLAFIVGPILGGVLLLLSWHWLFIINVPLAALIIWVSWLVLPRTEKKHAQQPFDLAGMVMLTIVMAGFTFGISQIDPKNLLSSLGTIEVWLPLLIAVLGLPLMIWQERRAPDPIIRPSLLGTRQLVLGNILAGGAGLSEAAVVFLPALAVAAFSVSESTASFLLLPMVLAMAVGSPLAGRWLDKWGSKVVVLIGSITVTVGTFMLSLVGGADIWLYLVAGMIISAGMGSLLGAPLRYIMLAEARLEDRAAAQGMLTVSTGIGQMVAGALVGAVADSFGGGKDGYTTAFLFVAFVTLALVILALNLKNQKQERLGQREETVSTDSLTATH
jgi:MFS family permease